MKLIEETTNTSIRKIITFLTILVFIGAQVSWLVANYGEELPSSYWGSDLAIIFFYFSKDWIRRLNISTK